MAIKMGNTKDIIKVIVRKDDAISDVVTDEEWKAYTETLDESKLTFKPGEMPTRFSLKTCLAYEAQEVVKNKQMTVGKDGKANFNLGYTMEETRCALVGIENPVNLPEDQHVLFVKEIDGFASKELISGLFNAGYGDDLFAIRQLHTKGSDSKKK
jgi:hypothetical protein